MLVDPRCDIYSLGACWYWLLTGTSAKGVNWEAKLRASVTVERSYERVLLRCLDQADKRYASAADLIEDVRALRSGTAPSQSPHDLTDDQARVLGVIVGACPTSSDEVSLYGMEQEIAGRQSRLRTSVALRGLLQRGLIDERNAHDENGEPYSRYRPTDPGAEWTERNIGRIEDLLRETFAAVPTPTEGDEIPF